MIQKDSPQSEMAEIKEMEANTKGSFGGSMRGNDLLHMER